MIEAAPVKMYFVIHSSEDGSSFEQLGEAKLIQRLNEHYWGRGCRDVECAVKRTRKPSRRETINAIVAQWGWSRTAATHAVDVWGFYPWKLTTLEPETKDHS